MSAPLARVTATSFVAGVVVAVIAKHAVAESFLGAALGTLFFAVSALVTSRASAASLRSALLNTYVVKIGVLVAMGVIINTTSLDRSAIAIATVTAAVAYVAGLVVINRR